MLTAMYILVGLIVLAVFYFLWRRVKSYQKFQGKMLVTCPETHQPAGVVVDAKHVAITAIQGEPDLRLKECTRWPERQNCGQECLAQIELSPQNCLVRAMLSRWYKDRSCAFCGRAFEQIDTVL